MRMDCREVLENLFRSFSGYYTIEKDAPAKPFVGEAEFHMHDEQYFLIRSAKISEADAREIIFFASEDELNVSKAEEYISRAWDEGINRVDPKPNHKSTDIGLIMVAGHIEDEAAKTIEKCKMVKSYSFGFRGYSHYRVAACSLMDGKIYTNRMGENLEEALKSAMGLS